MGELALGKRITPDDFSDFNAKSVMKEILEINSSFNKFQKNYGTGLEELKKVSRGEKKFPDLLDEGLYNLLLPMYAAGFAEENLLGFNIVHNVFSREKLDVSGIEQEENDDKLISVKDAQRVALGLYSGYIKSGVLNLPFALQERWVTYGDPPDDPDTEISPEERSRRYMEGYKTAQTLLGDTYRTLLSLCKNKTSELTGQGDKILKSGTRLYKEQIEELQEKYFSSEAPRKIKHAEEKIKTQFYVRKVLERINSL